jgi:hypothetical protein
MASPTGVLFRSEMPQNFQTVRFSFRYWYPVAATAAPADFTL